MTNQAIQWIRSQQSLTPGQAVLHLLRHRRDACAAPRAEGVDRQVQGQVRRRLGQVSRGDLRAAEEAGHRPAERQAGAQARRHQGLGHADAPTRSGCSRARWKSSPPSPRTPTTRSAASCKAIEDMGELDNTLILYEVGDNGASAEGGMIGMFNEMTYFNGVAETVPDMLKNIDKWGGPETFPHMAAGWAVAGNTPFMWTKQVASNFGGTRNPLVVSWPARHQGEGRDAQPVPARRRHRADGARSGRTSRSRRRSTASRRRRWKASAWSTPSTMRRPRTGTRRSTSRSSATAPSTTTAGWPPPSTRRRGKPQPRHTLAEDVWELYNVDEDFSEATDLAASNPAKLKELQALFMKEAEKYRVLPIDDRRHRALRSGHGGPPRPDGRPQVAHASTKA